MNPSYDKARQRYEEEHRHIIHTIQIKNRSGKVISIQKVTCIKDDLDDDTVKEIAIRRYENSLNLTADIIDSKEV